MKTIGKAFRKHWIIFRNVLRTKRSRRKKRVRPLLVAEEIPAETGKAISGYVFTPIYTVFPIGNPDLVAAVDAEAASETIAKGESATINMDGSCITLIISALYFARIYGLPVSANMLLSLFISIIILSMGSPGVPGGNLVCLTLLIPQIGVPAEAISLVMGLYPIIGMMQNMANVTGDAVVTTVTANMEGMLDKEKYYGVK